MISAANNRKVAFSLPTIRSLLTRSFMRTIRPFSVRTLTWIVRDGPEPITAEP